MGTACPRKARDFGPALHKRVVRQRFRCPLLALANSVQTVRELACGVRSGSKGRNQLTCCALAAGIEGANEVVHHFPDRHRGPCPSSLRKLLRLEQADLATTRLEDA